MFPWMTRVPLAACALALFLSGAGPRQEAAAAEVLQAGFAEVDITPRLTGDRPVYLAGFGHNRRATGVHDPLMARAVVLRHAGVKLALVSVDLVGLFPAPIERARRRLEGFRHVLVSSTHSHEGPDTMGLWGRSPLQSGLDPDYLETVEQGIVAAVKGAEGKLAPVRARLGVERAPELLHDNRLPVVKHDELVALELCGSADGKPAGVVLQWSCHPETLDSRNTRISADFVGYTAQALARKQGCPVVVFTGSVGGLMTSLGVEVRDGDGKPLADGTFEKTRRYGELVAEAAARALARARPVTLTPLAVRQRHVFLPVDNPIYQLAWRLGVLDRDLYLWEGDTRRAAPVGADRTVKEMCIRTELVCLELGQLQVAGIPGEIYPELVLGKVAEPADPGADFPAAPAEPSVFGLLRGPHRMLIGLANDEIGYIIPRRQWDESPPFCYGRKESQYGEINSLGPRTAPLLLKSFAEMMREK